MDLGHDVTEEATEPLAQVVRLVVPGGQPDANRHHPV